MAIVKANTTLVIKPAIGASYDLTFGGITQYGRTSGDTIGVFPVDKEYTLVKHGEVEVYAIDQFGVKSYEAADLPASLPAGTSVVVDGFPSGLAKKLNLNGVALSSGDYFKDIGLSPLPNSIVACGDSTYVDGFDPAGTGLIYEKTFPNIAWWAAAYSYGRLAIGSTCSRGGWTTEDVDQYWQERVAGKKIKFVVLGVGINNFNKGSDADAPAVDSYLRTWFMNKCAEVIAWGGIPIVATMFATPSSYISAAKRLRVNTQNEWRRSFCYQTGIPLLDNEAYSVDPTSVDGGTYAALSETNSIHPGMEIIRFCGQKLWDDIISKYVGCAAQNDSFSKFTANQLFANPALTGTGGNLQSGSGVVPNNTWIWGSSNVTTSSVEAYTDSVCPDGGVKSNWVKASITAAGATAKAEAGFLFINQTAGIRAVGDKYRATAEVEIVQPSTMVGLKCWIIVAGETTQWTMPLPAIACATDTSKKILTPTKILLPVLERTIQAGEESTSFFGLAIQAVFSGEAATVPGIFRVRNPRIWRAYN